MKLVDRIWLVGNRKQPGKWSYYSTIFSGGVATAFFAMLGVGLISTTKPWVGWLILLLTLGLVISGIIIDSKKGYVDALHKRHVELWQERRKKLGVK